MQLANYSKSFASKKAIDFILEILANHSRHSYQLSRDVASKYQIGMDTILNTIYLLVDHELVFKDSDENLHINTTLLGPGLNNSELSLEILSANLLVKDFLDKISTAIVETQEFGLCIDTNKIPQTHLTITHIYFTLQILEAPKNDRFWPVSQNYLSFFINFFPTALERFWENDNNMSLDALKKKIENQELAGDRAEVWILKQEKIRLINHPLKDNIVRVSNDNVNAGFDIASFKSQTSFQYDKFIEVKSYSGEPRFFISSNEFSKAKQLGSSYFLVIVDRDRMNDESYEPIQIINPFNTLMEGDLPDGVTIEPSNWKVTLIKNQQSAISI